jgi:RsiW-degrading membrane proteinase PrsW (M82 family)
MDLYEIATWEQRSLVDRLAVGLYWFGITAARAVVVGAALVILLVQFVFGGLGVALRDPTVVALTLLSVMPALAIAAYIWHGDVTTREPAPQLVATFVLAVLFASFAAVTNSALGSSLPSRGLLGVVASVGFFFLVVGPVEETVKLLAVRLHAFRSPSFNTVMDGAVYGAVAGLGFATIENAVYIGQQYLQASSTAGATNSLAVGHQLLQAGPTSMPPILSATQTAASRSFAGPGHVLYSSIAGYYLGLAKFNRGHAGPIVVKGLLIAAVIHASYNSLVGVAPGFLAYGSALDEWQSVIVFIIGFDVLIGYYLYRKLSRYRRAYRSIGEGQGEDIAAEVTEFE